MLALLPLLLSHSPHEIVLDKSGSQDGHTWRILMATSQVDPKIDKLSMSKFGKNSLGYRRSLAINGVVMMGLDSWDVAEQRSLIAQWRSGKFTRGQEEPWLIRRFVVWLDGKRIDVPRKDWADVLNLEPGIGWFEAGHGTQVAFGKRNVTLEANADASMMSVNLADSIGMEFIPITWNISKNGNVCRHYMMFSY
ncbi:MAG TPA: hypothetical protein VGL56_17655 [Fimbriimonadaceae bacterium]